ncbi:hypothetical protein EJ04DRAFT_603209 [Polyplosphaeria fusca]|uniref:Uncharacterized protein n=1 Tax=Polyplosphaeria fusca TaxID=682080 RepID=A0A9P4V2R6_9PLEO|nr:hypothetical protein EJ04DRAFT_603209 [Polyplosphaeria fusca]
MSNFIRYYFRSLAVIATLLLWGTSVWNGTVKALLLAVLNGRMSDNVPLETKFTGIPLIDLPIALLVAFFYYGTNGQDAGYNYFLVDAYSTLQSAFVWLYMEMAREGQKPKWVANPIVFGILWQCFGAAISLPLYYSIHLPWALVADLGGRSVASPRDAQAIQISFLFGALCPAVVGMLPTWLGPVYRSARQHQIVLAVWQPDPFWVSAIYALVSGFGPLTSPRARQSTRHSYPWVRATYVLAAVCSAAGHLCTVAQMINSSGEPKLGLTHMYMPSFTGPSETTNILTSGPRLFLQYDLVIIAISSLSWAFLLCRSALEMRAWQQIRLAFCMMLGALVIGPGATVSLVLLVREAAVHRRCELRLGKSS